jgi:hypothetical protein
MADRKKPLKGSGGGMVIVYSYIHYKTKKRIRRKNGKPFAFPARKKAA